MITSYSETPAVRKAVARVMHALKVHWNQVLSGAKVSYYKTMT